MSSGRPILFVNARVVDPATGHDERGSVLVSDGIIQDVGAIPGAAEAETIDCDGQVLAPG